MSARSGLARGLWLCPVLSLLLAAGVLLLLGMRWWTVLIAVVVLACPITAGWVLLADRLSRREIERGFRKP